MRLTKTCKHRCLAWVLLCLIASGCSVARDPGAVKGHTQENKSPTDRVLRVSHSEKNAVFTEKNALPPYSGIAASDPWETSNRTVYAASKNFDKVLFKPIARAYNYLMPELIDRGVSNFFSNLGDVGNAFNNVLQAKPRAAFDDSVRLVFNSTIGLAGFLDVASAMGIEKHDEDFGQTLAKWGVPSGPFVMLPLLGPSTVRDALSRFSVDMMTDPVNYLESSGSYSAIRILDKRADFLQLEGALSELGDDQYGVMRDAWLQQRQYLIRDGKIETRQHSDLIDQLEALEKE